ncbi:type II toxin-antitoxin system death-on-curing family toxin [Candidatus Gottesmanbacteria bacterium]|nr:type II toxin-antitoxin system death-on-curing family toxin [Candidatus Gottesmanbacteria bacterium]
MIYLEIDEVIAIHEKMLEIGGGREGIRDFTLIHSAVARPKATFAGKLLYPTIWLQAAALIQSLIRNHPFDDGNKRTGFFSTLRFLDLNGYDINATEAEIISFARNVDVKRLPIEDIASFLKKHAKRLK